MFMYLHLDFGEPEGSKKIMFRYNVNKDILSHEYPRDIHETLLMECFMGNAKKVKELIENKANIEARDENGWTPLMLSALAADGNGSECVITLINAGAKLDLVSNNGSSALMLAVENGHYECAYNLLCAGADVNIIGNRKKSIFDKENEGKSALDYAIDKKNNPLYKNQDLLLTSVLLAKGATLTNIRQLQTFLSSCDDSNPCLDFCFGVLQEHVGKKEQAISHYNAFLKKINNLELNSNDLQIFNILKDYASKKQTLSAYTNLFSQVKHKQRELHQGITSEQFPGYTFKR